jgi:hypothetical protein
MPATLRKKEGRKCAGSVLIHPGPVLSSGSKGGSNRQSAINPHLIMMPVEESVGVSMDGCGRRQ